jgi:DNA-binding response OmpR family regulator
MTGQPGDILLVEDDEWERLSFEIILQKEGYQVTPAVNGQEAIDLASLQRYGVVIMDLFLGDMLAFEIIPELKKLNPIPKVILITAEPRDKYKWKAYELGVDVYLVKPVSPDELLRALKQYT